MNQVYEVVRKNHVKAGYLVALACAWIPPYSVYWGFQNRPLTAEKADLVVYGLHSPLIAWVGLQLSAVAIMVALSPKRKERARAREIKKEVFSSKHPTMHILEDVVFGLSGKEVIHQVSNVIKQDADSTARLAEQTRNPYVANSAAGQYFGRAEIDNALDMMRKSFDWSAGKRGRRSFSVYPITLAYSLAEKVSYCLFPGSSRICMELAAYRSLFEPERAWAWSECGRRLAQEIDRQYVREAYVFHALLASAQRRSDEQSAWRDALQLLMADTQVESASERESRSEVFRFNGDFFANTLVVKRRPDLASLVREHDWQQKGRGAASACDVPELVYISRENDGLSCLAMRYRKGDVLYDLLEKGNKSSTVNVATALGEIHAKVSHDGLNRVEIWKKARDKLYDPLLGVPKDLANTILAHYGPIERGSWLAPAVINKDAHPEQWILGDRLTAIDWEIDSLVPLTFDSANFTSYRDFFSPQEQRDFVGSHINSYRQHGGDMRGEDVLTSFYNAVIHRMICFIGAWSGPSRKKMRAYRKEAVGRAIGAIDALESVSPTFYHDHADDYRMLRKSFAKVADLMVP